MVRMEKSLAYSLNDIVLNNFPSGSHFSMNNLAFCLRKSSDLSSLLTILSNNQLHLYLWMSFPVIKRFKFNFCAINGKCIPKIISRRFHRNANLIIRFLILFASLSCSCLVLVHECVASFLHTTTTSLESNYDYNGICFTENAYFWPIIHILFYRMSVCVCVNT